MLEKPCHALDHAAVEAQRQARFITDLTIRDAGGEWTNEPRPSMRAMRKALHDPADMVESRAKLEGPRFEAACVNKPQ